MGLSAGYRHLSPHFIVAQQDREFCTMAVSTDQIDLRIVTGKISRTTLYDILSQVELLSQISVELHELTTASYI